MELSQGSIKLEDLEKSFVSDTSSKDTTQIDETNSTTSSQSTSEIIDSNSISDSEHSDGDELPDLEAIWTPMSKAFSEGTIVWALTKSLWWPAYIRKLYPREKKASILFINSTQRRNIKLPYSRLKKFYKLSFLDLVIKQKHKDPLIEDAIQVAHFYIDYQCDISQPAEVFFSLPIFEQWRILNKFIMGANKKKEGTVETPSRGAPGPIRRVRRRLNTISPLSKEQRKEKAAQKSTEIMKMRCLRYIKTKKIQTHLANISKGRIQCKRHEYFKSIKDMQYLWEVFLKQENPAFDFFGESGKHLYNEAVNFLTTLFDDAEFEFDAHSSVKRMYVILVLVPEAFKMCLLDKMKVAASEVEETLAKGPFSSKIEDELPDLGS